MLFEWKIFIIQNKRRPMGPIRYVVINGKAKSMLLIENFWDSLTIQPPIKRFIETKCIQKSIKNDLSVNKFNKLSIPIYKLKFPIKSKELKKDL
mgnify:FL=1